MRALNGLVLLVSLGFLSACMNTTAQMDVRPTTKNSSFKSIQANESKTTFALAKIINDIDRGEPIFAFPAQTKTKGTLCNAGVQGDATITYEGGKQYLGDWSSELGELFYETLTKLGYKVAGDPDDIFNQSQGVSSAEYLIGGRLIKSSGNFCHEHHWWDGRPLNQFSGEMSLTIEWSVLNTLTQSVVVKEKVNGYYKLDKPAKNGISMVFEGAFEDSADNFARSSKLKKLAVGEQLEEVTIQTNTESIRVNNGKKQSSFDIENIKNSIATIRIGMGHGSAFFIGKDGLLLTNAHVVGNASQVQVITSSGIEITGEVISKNKVRDVALIKTPLKISDALHLDLVIPSVATEVYAVGTPINEALKTTVTKGIISAIRKDATNGLEFIQSDAAISPGNSGGPLFDNNGNVVGISVAKFSGNSAEGLGLFIPLADAVNAVGVSLD